MIKSFTAATREIDDAQSAVAEILAELGLHENLMKHSIGIISCFSEFEETGVLSAVCDALPFDCVGATTCLCASGNDLDQLLFSITVLTSEDCNFNALCVPIDVDYTAAIGTALTSMLSQVAQRPALFLSYFPLMNNISGDMILSAIDSATGGIPLFGTMAVDHNADYSTAKTLYNGKAFREALVLCAISGPVQYTVDIASLKKEKIRGQKAIITASIGNILTGVNGKTALAYLEEVGLSKADLETGLGILPLVVDHKDGTKPVARSVFTLTPEGHAVCGGAMPVNATIALGGIDRTDVLETIKTAVPPHVDSNSMLFSYSCVGRYYALGADNTAEAELLNDLVGEMPHLFAISGGEICPLPDANGKLKNFFHNYTNILCRIR